MSLAELFTKNYEYLNTVAKRITRSRDQKLAPDLLNSTYLVIFEKHEKGLFVPKENEEFVKWFSKCMKNYFTWPNSDFNQFYYSKEHLSIDSDYNKTKDAATVSEGQSPVSDSYSNRFDELIIDEDALRNIEIGIEQVNDFTRELIEISSSLGRNKTLKFIELVEFKRTLPAHEATLFELYFEMNLSTRRIASLYSEGDNIMNYQSVNIMVNQIKSKIKEHEWKQLNS